MHSPLADRIRPASIDEVAGQSHLLGKNMPLRRIIDSGRIPNMIFYGSSGIGKTTVARIIADQTNLMLHKLNGTQASVSDIKDVIAQTETIDGCEGILLYIDEIQYLNKKQQQSLLEFIENGKITLIASTTENPYFYIYNAIISRSTIFEFHPLSPDELVPVIERAFRLAAEYDGLEFKIEDGVVKHIASGCAGDVRKAITAAELCILAGEPFAGGVMISLKCAESLTQRSNMRYDRDGDMHYDILSAFQKSIRGSDENAALHYLARLVEAGDIISTSRRLLVIASEDIGLAYPQAISIVKSCVDSAMQLGLPEARIPLAQAVILLCTSPKSNSAIDAIDGAIKDIKKGNIGEIPKHLKDGHYEGAEKLGNANNYKYPHSYKNSYVNQQYLPDILKDKIYYRFGENKQEQAAKQYRIKIMNASKLDM